MTRLHRWRSAPRDQSSPADPRAEVDLMRGATNHYTGPTAQGPRNRAFSDIPPAPGDANAAFAALMGILFRALWRLITSPFRLAARAFALISRRSP